MVFASSRTAWRWGSGIWLRVREVVGVGQMVWSAMSAPSSAAAVFASAIVDEQSCAIFVICLLDGVCASFMSAATVSRSPFIAVSAAVASAIAVVVVEHRGHFAVAGCWWLAGIVPVRAVGPWLMRLMVHERPRHGRVLAAVGFASVVASFVSVAGVSSMMGPSMFAMLSAYLLRSVLR
jgi:hypothetical protein